MAAEQTRITALISDNPLDPGALSALVADDRAGAVVSFLGVVRNHDRGRAVTEIEYVGHPDAPAIIARIAGEIAARPGIEALAVAHRVGTLAVGDLAMAASVSAAHRSDAFAAASDLVDQVKAELPIWKRQVFPDGTHEWTNCP